MNWGGGRDVCENRSYFPCSPKGEGQQEITRLGSLEKAQLAGFEHHSPFLALPSKWCVSERITWEEVYGISLESEGLGGTEHWVPACGLEISSARWSSHASGI